MKTKKIPPSYFHPDVRLASFVFLQKLIPSLDLFQDDLGRFLSLVDRDFLERFAWTYFVPLSKAWEKEDESEDPMLHRRRGGYSNRKEFESLNNPGCDTYDYENDLHLFCKAHSNGASIFQGELLKELEFKTHNFQIEKTLAYRKIKKTFETLGISQKLNDLCFLVFVCENNTNLKDWITNKEEKTTYLIKQLTGLGKSEIAKETGKKSKPVIFGIWESMRMNSFDRFIEFTSSFHRYLEDDSQDTFGMHLLKEIHEETKPMDSFFLPEVEKEELLSLLRCKDSAKILFYGEPGSGKTEFAKTLAKEANLTVLSVENIEIDGPEERRAALIVGEQASKNKRSLVLMDEADSLLNEGMGFSFFGVTLNSSPEKKIWINEFLDQTDSKILFITNEFKTIHSSVLRRFDYSMEFMAPEEKQRAHYWNLILEKQDLLEEISEVQAREFAATFPIGVGGIATSVASAKKIWQQDTSKDLKRILADVLNKHIQVLRKKIKKPLLSETPYDRTILHTDSNLEDLEKLVKEYHDKLTLEKPLGMGSLCLLFYGAPGTGKTEYARYLAKNLGIEIMQKRGSDLHSMWVGETEKNIAKAFREAERNKSIFFLDEADTFFRSRDLAQRSWEGSATNEFLTWMENFQGIFIASTNFLKDFDQAALRRFAWKGEFKALRRDDKWKLLTSYFPKALEKATELEKANVMDIPSLTPGDLKAVWNRIRFRNPEEISMEQLIENLRTEVSFKKENEKKVVGFSC